QAMTIVHLHLTEEEKSRRQRKRSRKTGSARPARRSRRSGGGRVSRSSGALSTRSADLTPTGMSSAARSNVTPGGIGSASEPTPIKSPMPGGAPAEIAGSASGTGPGRVDPPSVAVLGDTNPGEVRGGGRSREAHTPRSLMPVDYLKAPPMYTHTEPMGGQAPQGIARPKPINPAAAIPTTSEDPSQIGVPVAKPAAQP